MGTCASVKASQAPPLAEGPVMHPDTVAAVFTRSSQTGTSAVKANTRALDLDDATPENLKEALNLDFYPKAITDKKTNKTKIHQGPPSQPFPKLEANAEYEVEGGKNEKEGEEDLYKWKTGGVSMRTGDVQRALICSEAMYRSNLPDNDAIQQFFDQERNLHNFVRVSISRYGPVRYLLAETRDKEEVFVAFKGTTGFKDVLADLNIWQEGAGQSQGSHNSGVSGKYHTGFMRLAFLVPANRILEEYSNSLIVVCGHSLGGAVAHIVAINMMIHLCSNDQPIDKVKSIAFGAPYFGNDGALQFAEEYNLSPHLLTIVNEKDPVPYILRLAETVQCLGLTALEKLESILDLLTASAPVKQDRLDKCRGMLKEWGDSKSARELDSLYVPLGWYLHISCSTHKAGGGGHWRRNLLDHIGAIQYARPDIRDWKVEDFQCHRVCNYRTAFFQIAKSTTYQKWGDDDNNTSSDVIIMGPICPARIDRLSVYVLNVKDDIKGSKSTKTCQIKVEGDNLEFLEMDNPISGLQVPDGKFAVPRMSRTLVVLQCDIQTDSLFAGEATIRTHFEEVKVPIDGIKEVSCKEDLPHTCSEGLLRDVAKNMDEILDATTSSPKGEESGSVWGAALFGAASGVWNWGVKKILG